MRWIGLIEARMLFSIAERPFPAAAGRFRWQT
jgi:hypothetical protein